MELSNVDKIYAEYPFINDIFPRKKAWRATVSRWGKDFLKESNSYDPRCRFFLLNEKGNILTRVGGRGHLSFLCYIIGIGEKIETVGQALHRMDSEAKKVRYAIRFNGNHLCLYKLPNECKDIEDFLEYVLRLESESEKIQETKETRRLKIGRICNTIRYAKTNSDEEIKLIALIDEMHLSSDEWNETYNSYGTRNYGNWVEDVPKLMEKMIQATISEQKL